MKHHSLEEALDILDFDFKANGCAWMPLTEAQRDFIVSAINSITETVSEPPPRS